MPDKAPRQTVGNRGCPVLAFDCALAGAEWMLCPAAELGRRHQSTGETSCV